MGLDLARLEKVKHRGSNVIARCPACAESGNDRKGEHLMINSAGQFGCVVFPGESGQQHRQRIFDLAGVNPSTLPGLKVEACSGLTLSEVEWVKETHGKGFEIRKAPRPASRSDVIQKDILGHLGRIQSTHARKIFKMHLRQEEYKTQENWPDAVPNVPDDRDDVDPTRPF